MTLESGRKLGPYEIVEPLGAGGMGEVYRARDTRLDRQVAIKVLPAALSSSEQLRTRFEREAKTISQLSHPHICTLHDVGNEDGVEFLVMEYLEGESLAQTLERGALPLDEAIRYGIQVANALDKAHRQGVVHRDLKPGNVMITATGAKLLDFGLAKMVRETTEPTEGLTNLPTQQKNLTEEGTILGTVQYMAPEQLEGREADPRTDIFAFGALLFEMITGRKVFQGKSRVSLMAAILEHQPPSIATIQPLSPPALDRLIRTCLEKRADDRWQTAHDLELQLRWIEEGGSDVGLPAPVVARRKGRERLAWIVAALAVVTAGAFGWLWYGSLEEPQPMIRSSVLPSDLDAYGPDDGIAISPDGTQLVYVAENEANSQLWIRRLDSDEAQPLRGTDDAYYPFWSPDGKEIAFFASGKLKRISASGGNARSLADVQNARGGTWSSDGWIIYAPAARGPLHRIAATGGPTTEVTTLEEGSAVLSHRWPWLLPDNQHVLFLAQTGEGGTEEDQSTIRIVDLETGKDEELVLANSSMQYSTTGHLLYWSQGGVIAQPFDAEELRLDPMVYPVAEGVLYTPNEYAAFCQTGKGMLLFQQGSAMGGLSQLTWISEDGTRTDIARAPDSYFGPSLSPDERRLAVEIDNDIWIIDLARGASSRLTFDDTQDSSATWSNDGEWIYYQSNSVQDGATIRRKRSSGVGEAEILLEKQTEPAYPEDISSDNKRLLFTQASPDTSWDIWFLDLESGETTKVIASPFVEPDAKFGPTPDWIVYMSSESGRFEVYVQRIAGAGGRWQISTSGGRVPKWSHDGRTIFFLNGQTLYRVDVALGESPEFGIPENVADIGFRQGPFSPYDVSSDGTRFVFMMSEGDEAKSPMTLVQNWTRMLER